MRRLVFFLALLGFAGSLAEAQSVPTPIQGGPIYTRLESDKTSRAPVFPEFEAVVPLDPKWNAQAYSAHDWTIRWPGQRDMPATGVRRFGDTGYGVAVVLALDVSGSMKGRTLDSIRSSVLQFVDQAQPQDRVAVATIADEMRWDVSFTAQPAEVKTAIAGLTARGHETHLYDALLEAVDHFDASLPKRHVLVVISDGHDEGSQHTLDEVVAAARSHRIAIEAIGVTHSDPKYLKSLEALADETGGSYAAARSEDELNELIGNGVAALNQTPVVSGYSMLSGPTPMSVPLTITWKPQQIQVAVTLETEPDLSARHERGRRSIWIAGGVLLIILLLGLWLVLRRRKAAPPAPGTQVASVVLPEPVVLEPVVPEAKRYPEVAEATVVRPVPAIPVEQPLPLRRPAPVLPDPPARPTRLAHTFSGKPQQPMAFLDVSAGPLAGTRIAVDRSPFRIGADAENELPISDDATLSSRHAQLLLERSILMLEDLGSTNGTWVNGVRTAGRVALAPGDELKMGASIFRVVRAFA
jgi:VWFA-related protein